MRTSDLVYPIRVTIFLLPLLLAGFSCKNKDDANVGHDYVTPIVYFEKCVPHHFDIKILPYNELTGTTYSEKHLADTSQPRDAEGIRLTMYDDSLFYQPLSMCHVALELVAAYRGTGDSSYLGMAKKYIRRLIENTTECDGALYYVYPLDYKVHRMKKGFLKAPWYSGMAQGEILGLMVRMFWATGDSVYIDYAERTFRTFLRPRGEGGPWTVFVNPQGCYWIEEYPTEPPSQTLNGFIYSLYGLYDYYLLTRTEEVEKVLQDCLSTLKNYIPSYRRPGKPSFYNLRFRHWSKPYHMAHIAQFRHLYKITEDEFFKEWANIFEQDFKL